MIIEERVCERNSFTNQKYGNYLEIPFIEEVRFDKRKEDAVDSCVPILFLCLDQKI